jgi:hypothetical protein
MIADFGMGIADFIYFTSLFAGYLHSYLPKSRIVIYRLHKDLFLNIYRKKSR